MSGTSPDSVSYPEQNYGILGPLPAYVINIQDVPGADPTGNDDSTLAINAALASLPDSGGELVLAPGTYKFSDHLRVKSNTAISGSGTLKAAPIADWSGPWYFGIVNANANLDDAITNPRITDGETLNADITVRGITIDYSDVVNVNGSHHCIFFFRVARVVIDSVTVLAGQSSVALLACDNTTEINNSYYGFLNCGSDHWSSPRNASVIGCHIETDISAQMVNWNPEYSGPDQTGAVASGFTMTGCTLVSREASATPCQIEPLRESMETACRDVTITGNVFKNCTVVCRGNVDGIVITDNVFSDLLGDAGAITCHPKGTGIPGSIIVTNNIVRNPQTSSVAVGVIRVVSDKGIMFGNTVLGSGYTAAPFSVQTSACQMLGNYSDDGSVVSGRLWAGMRLANGTDRFYGWTDASGTVPRMYLQADNTWVFSATDSAGAERVAMSMAQRSSSSELNISVPLQITGAARLQITPRTAIAAAGTTIGTATVLAGNYNEITSCTTGVDDGVSLHPDAGFPQTVINTSADTLQVYPNNSGSSQIDGGGVGVPTTIAAGKSKTFVQLATGDFRTIATS